MQRMRALTWTLPRGALVALTGAVVIVCLAGSAGAADPASVLVTTAAPRQGAVPDTVVAYGAAAQLPSDSLTLSVEHEGEVQHLAVTAGQSVAAGAALLQVAASPGAVSVYSQATAALALARSQRAHTAQLLAQHLATRDQLEQADKAVADAQSALDALRLEGADQAVETVVAPFDGIVISVAVAQGALVQANAPLLTLARRDRMAVTVGLEPAEQSKLHAGQPVRLESLTDGGATLDGSVEQVGAMLDPKTRLVDAVIAVGGGDPLVGSEYRAVITVGQQQGWLVPRDAVLSDADGAFVFQVADGKAVRVSVRVVGAQGQTTVVQGPIDANRRLVTQGNYQLSDGMAVRVANA